MAHQTPSLYELLGHSMQGDLGGMTCYTARNNRVVWFVKSPPLEQASPTQRQIRNLFVANGLVWRAMPAASRQTWHAAADGARLRIHGYNLFVWWMRFRDRGTLKTIERISGITIHTPPE